VATLALSRAPADRAVAIVRYAAEPTGANPSAALLNPITIRFDCGRFVEAPLVVAASPTCSGDREKVAPNGFTAMAVTVPMIVGPFPATNDTDAPPICALVTVRTCGPTAGDNVQWTEDSPLLSVVDVVALSDPPPTTVHLSETPLTDFDAPSSTRTTSAESSAVATFADWLLPDTTTIDVGVCGIVGESWQARSAAAVNATAVVARKLMD
jgi:hypothetical protein